MSIQVHLSFRPVTYFWFCYFISYVVYCIEMEQGKAKGEGEQHGIVWSGKLWQASFRSSKIQAYYSFHPFRQIKGMACLIPFKLVSSHVVNACLWIVEYGPCVLMFVWNLCPLQYFSLQSVFLIRPARSHIGWGGERNIVYKSVETSP